MARPGLTPIAAAVALTVAAGLSIAAEHARSSPAAALALPAPQGTGDAGGDHKAAGVSGGTSGEGHCGRGPAAGYRLARAYRQRGGGLQDIAGAYSC